MASSYFSHASLRWVTCLVKDFSVGEVSEACSMACFIPFSQLTSSVLLRASLFLASSSAMAKKDTTGGSEEASEIAEKSMLGATGLAAYLE